MFLRILLLSALIVFVGWIAGNALRRLRGPDAAAGGRAARRDALPAMVACAHCGVHLPQDDAVPDGDRWYCSTAHRDAAAADR